MENGKNQPYSILLFFNAKVLVRSWPGTDQPPPNNVDARVPIIAQILKPQYNLNRLIFGLASI